MHIQDLPEELLVEILGLCLLLPPADFFADTRLETASQALVCQDRAPAADVLLVCQQWARIGTPQLYSSLQLVSRRHIDCVAPLLAAHPHLAACVRNLRVSSRHSRSLLALARTLPHVSAVCVVPPFDPTPSGVVHLSELLRVLEPEALYIGHLGASMIAPFVEQSANLKSMHFMQYARITKDVKDAIVRSLSLEQMTFTDLPFTSESERDDWWIRVVTESSLKQVVFPEAQKEQKHFEEQFDEHPQVLKLVTFN
ncbi:hypothetical protein PsYK624_080120 [Phanerochaete sordida]|uniref:Uncharacterized protein n=1 Tax=Phanerochaete sordida TaxID=48140 RepID=A0A9P3GBS2_9APHY|nr:hypothetical protein PsYK624_080120 [Phanerochaete sordida]